jgi:HTH-type transcriptional repressor of NAD biosynthesis genes
MLATATGIGTKACRVVKMAKRVGLTLGKFAPLHRGHQYVIETALAEMDEVWIMIYDTDVIDIPLSVRANWLRRLYPAERVRVIEARNGPQKSKCSTERAYEIAEEQFIMRLLDDQQITHFYSSEPYGRHVSIALDAVDRRVDEARQQVPISATMIRGDAYRYRSYVHPLVYADFVQKVVFVGAMSTGKSTIVEALAARYQTVFMPEYGRKYWETRQINRRLPFEAFIEIAQGHIRREDELVLQARRFLFCDTNAWATRLFCLDYHGRCSAELDNLCDQVRTRYSLVFLCEDDIPYDDTWDRSGEQKRSEFHRLVVQDLHERNIPFVRLRGSLEQRMNTVDQHLQRL